MVDLPPKRASIDPDNMFYQPWHIARLIGIKLNGVIVKECTAYNQIEGWIERFKRDDNGRLVVNVDELVLERVKGVVSLDWIKDE